MSLTHTFVDLGMSPLCESYIPAEHLDEAESFYPLHVRVCSSCLLVQLPAYVPGEDIFSDYAYFSSYSDSWVAHAKRYAESMIGQLALTSSSLVTEVASNDGYLLQHFVAEGIPVLGVEPAANVARVASSRGIRTVVEFLSARSGEQIAGQYGPADLVAANNVFAHVPDIVDFAKGLRALVADDGLVSIEIPHLLKLVEGREYDTIYHEHFSYLTAHAVSAVADQHGLILFDVVKLATHGGSNRYLICRSGAREVHQRVGQVLQEERDGGLFEPGRHDAFARGARQTIEGLRAWFDQQRAAGRRVAGYGAAAKGNTLLNAILATSADLVAVADASVEKQHRYLPGTDIPVIAPDALASSQPDEVLILPWNLQGELVPLLTKLVPGRTIWIAVPAMRQVSIGG
jgi:C-methyltransferase C-terminal domain/Putative zinc binding domain/Methyltransferase domain